MNSEMKRIFGLYFLIVVLFSCDKKEDFMPPVELRFSNSTGIFIDSVFFNVGREVHNYKVVNMNIDETTDYIKFDNGYFNVATTVHNGSIIIDHPTTDLLCCLSEGKYTVDFEIFIDENNEEKTSTKVIEDN